tara:strand:+ start:564 stop:755 length:192 start_codon:yes stop_codon:yes gene_type:complete
MDSMMAMVRMMQFVEILITRSGIIMSELKQVSMDFLITLIYEAKKHRDFIFGLLLGLLVGKII